MKMFWILLLSLMVGVAMAQMPSPAQIALALNLGIPAQNFVVPINLTGSGGYCSVGDFTPTPISYTFIHN